MIPWAIARAGSGRRRHGHQGDASQRGGPRPQGHPRGRPGRRHARRRSDPAGRVADHAASGPGKEKKYRPPEEVPRLRDADRQARGRGLDPLPQPLRLPRPGRFRRSSTSRRRERWTSRATARSSSTASTTRAWCARCPTSTRLTVEQLEQLEGFQRKSAENLVDAIERSKQQPFNRVLYGWASRASATSTRVRSPRTSASIDRLIEAGAEEIEAGRGNRARCWPATISETLAEPRNRELIDELREVGLQLEQEARRRRPARFRSRERRSSSPARSRT